MRSQRRCNMHRRLNFYILSYYLSIHPDVPTDWSPHCHADPIVASSELNSSMGTVGMMC